MLQKIILKQFQSIMSKGLDGIINILKTTLSASFEKYFETFQLLYFAFYISVLRKRSDENKQ